MSESLSIEIFASDPGEWRVLERSRLATEALNTVRYRPEVLANTLEAIERCLAREQDGGESQRDGLRRLGARLAELVLPPALAAKLSGWRGAVDFFLDDASAPLPLEIVPHGDGVLCESVPVSRHWLCRQAGEARAVGDKRAKQVLIVADPRDNLPDAGREGEAVFRMFRNAGVGWRCRFLSESVSAADLALELPGTDLLHLAAHCVAGGGDGDSGVMLADGAWLPPEATRAPAIVFMNCCRAGNAWGNTGLALTSALLRQGARHIVAPFLPVSDQVARRFAERFYECYLAGGGVAAAIFAARRAAGPAGWVYWHFGSIETEAPRWSRRRRGILVGIALACAIGAFLLAARLIDAFTPEAIETDEKTRTTAAARPAAGAVENAAPAAPGVAPTRAPEPIPSSGKVDLDDIKEKRMTISVIGSDIEDDF